MSEFQCIKRSDPKNHSEKRLDDDAEQPRVQWIGVIFDVSVLERREMVRLLGGRWTVIERNERELDAALKRSVALRQSILKKAFAGQLVPQDPTDEPASELLERIREERVGMARAPKRKNSA
jgi:hypothetical protein